MNKKIGILTTFGGWDDAYSPCNVVKHQLLTLLRYEYEPVLFVLDCFPRDFQIEGVEIRRVIPTTQFEPYQGVVHHKKIPRDFPVVVDKIAQAYQTYFRDIDVMLCHDIIFQDSFLAYNAALRSSNLRVKTQFFHWMHSGPSLRPAVLEPPVSYLYTVPPNSRLVYMNNLDTTAVAEMYGTYPSEIRVVHNPIDYRFQPGIHPLVDLLISKFGLNDADVVAVYPLSTTRMGVGGKQLHKAIKVMAGIKKQGLNVRLIVPNAHANGQTEKLAIKEMMITAEQMGLDARYELVFTSLIDPPEWESGVPHEVVTQLMRYSDIFLFPSISENAPLSLLEAGLGKNLLVLNEDFSPMKDFVGPNALYFKFDSRNTTTTHERGEDVYYEDCAKIIVSELYSNKIYKSFRDIKQRFNIDYIFRNELEPLFYDANTAAPQMANPVIPPSPRLVAVPDTSPEKLVPEPMPFNDQPPEEPDEERDDNWSQLTYQGQKVVSKEETMDENYHENEEREDFPEFDQIFDRYKRVGLLKPKEQIKIYEAISRNWCVGKRVLDVGCGVGIGTNILAREALGTWGVDNQEDNVKVARQLYEGPKLKFDVYDLVNPSDRPVGQFDVVTCIEVIEHIDDYETALNNLKRFYDPKGRTIFFISTPNRNNSRINKAGPKNPHHVREFTAGELYEILTRHFRSVVIFDHNKLDTFDQSETMDGDGTATPMLFKCEEPI